MEFWSKGLGKRTIALTLTKGEALKSEGTLCLRGNMEEPVSWEYIMKLEEDDLIDFFGLLRDRSVADFVFDSSNRWQLYGGMLAGGLRLGVLVVTEMLRKLLRRAQVDEDVAIQVPPPSVRKGKRKRGPVRRRLGSKSIAAPKLGAAADNWLPSMDASDVGKVLSISYIDDDDGATWYAYQIVDVRIDHRMIEDSESNDEEDDGDRTPPPPEQKVIA